MFTCFQFVSLGTEFEVYLCMLFTCVQLYANTFKAQTDIDEEMAAADRRLACRRLLHDLSAQHGDEPFSVPLQDNGFILRIVW